MPVVCKQDNTIATVCTQVGCAQGGAQAQTLTVATVCTSPIICKQNNTLPTVCTQIGCAQGGAQAQTTFTVVTIPVTGVTIGTVTLAGHCPGAKTLGLVCHDSAQAQTIGTVPPICFPTTITQPLGACPPQGGAAQAQGITGAICSIIPTACIVTAVAHC
jgi:hypothetical protein